MHDPGLPLTEILFTLIVFAAIMALFTEYADLVVAVLLVAVIWQLVDLLGASLFLATVMVFIFVAVRTIAMAVGAQVGTPTIARFLDAMLTAGDAPERDHRERRGLRQETERIDTDVDSIDDYRR